MSHIWIGHDSHMVALYPTYKFSMFHTWLSYVPHMNTTSLTYEWEHHVPHMNTISLTYQFRHVSHINEACPTYDWDTCHIWLSYLPHMNKECLTYQWVMSHIWMSRKMHMHKFKVMRVHTCAAHSMNLRCTVPYIGPTSKCPAMVTGINTYALYICITLVQYMDA